MGTADLKPCPFCPSTNWVMSSDDHGYAVKCEQCNTFGPRAQTKQDAIALWNKRAEEERIKREMDESGRGLINTEGYKWGEHRDDVFKDRHLPGMQ